MKIMLVFAFIITFLGVILSLMMLGVIVADHISEKRRRKDRWERLP